VEADPEASCNTRYRKRLQKSHQIALTASARSVTFHTSEKQRQKMPLTERQDAATFAAGSARLGYWSCLLA
jgi:hypothetical protein